MYREIKVGIQGSRKLLLDDGMVPYLWELRRLVSSGHAGFPPQAYDEDERPQSATAPNLPYVKPSTIRIISSLLGAFWRQNLRYQILT